MTDVLRAADTVGSWLAFAYGVYAIVVLGMLSLFGVHALVLVCTIFWLKGTPLRARGFLQAIADVFYGLINPVFYLLVLTAAGPLWLRYPTTRAILSTTASALLLFIWGVRLLRPTSATTPSGVRAVIMSLRAGAAVVCAHGLFDLVTLLLMPYSGSARPNGESAPVMLVTALLVAPLYAIPLVRIATWLQALREAGSDEVDGSAGVVATGFFTPRPVARLARFAAAAMLIAGIATSAPRWTDRRAHAVVSRHHDTIVATARSYGVSPRTLAAILWVTQRDQLTPLRDVVERLAVSIWRIDNGSHLATAGMSVSIGLMQVKPTTLQTVAHIRDHSVDEHMVTGRWGGDIKDMRDASAGGSEWRLPVDRLRSLATPFPPLGKSAAVAGLLDDRLSIHAAAIILALYQLQWESANPAWSIRDRPEILATLYQIGFERSHPHAQPRANHFGRRVKQIHDEAWLRAAFPDRTP